MEREVLAILLRGKQPVVLCPARNIGTRIARDAERAEPLEQGRMFILSPFDDKDACVTVETSAARDLAAAERNLPDDHDWAYTIAYNAVLQAARALVLAYGFRPRAAESHATVVQFIEEALGKKYATQIALFDQTLALAFPPRPRSPPRWGQVCAANATASFTRWRAWCPSRKPN
jgi:hypothetical protein